ncbi:hypothetical protein [Proteiniphilum sp. UBA5384]|uniref:hypothetical protein n=1 Tax=Proteiniphilum sp. UBA5384 TaxID=1947279 RepID=UPI0025F0B071|nr:hypothetical protein [Proteiniphilum sp. UBA5384]
MWAYFIMAVCSTLLFSSELSDRINLSRLGGTTRGASESTQSYDNPAMEPVVEAYNLQNAVSISVQNYRGSALVEIIGPREVRQSFIEVYDMGFDMVDLSGLRAGNYTIRITLGSAVYTGTLKIATYGR